jgi:predicted phosphodiesterase
LKPPKKIFFGSDFHYERFGNQYAPAMTKDYIPEDAPFDYLILAGDMTHTLHVPGLLKAVREYSGVPVFYTPGNHEFWDGVKHHWNMDEQVQYMREGLAKVEGVTFLYNEGMDIPDTNYSIFMSPWFTNLVKYEDYDADGNVFQVPQSEIQKCIGDYHRSRVNGFMLTAEDHIKMNQEAVSALETWLERDVLSKGRIPIIVTHFGPSRRSAHRDFPQRDIVAAYFNTDYLDDGGPGYIWPKGSTWIHGHTHQNVDYMIGDMRVVTNQYGYKGESSTNDSFEFMKHIEVR